MRTTVSPWGVFGAVDAAEVARRPFESCRVDCEGSVSLRSPLLQVSSSPSLTMPAMDSSSDKGAASRPATSAPCYKTHRL